MEKTFIRHKKQTKPGLARPMVVVFFTYSGEATHLSI